MSGTDLLDESVTLALEALRDSLRRQDEGRDILPALRVQVLALAGHRPGEIQAVLGMGRHEYSRTRQRLREALAEACGET